MQWDIFMNFVPIFINSVAQCMENIIICPILSFPCGPSSCCRDRAIPGRHLGKALPHKVKYISLLALNMFLIYMDMRQTRQCVGREFQGSGGPMPAAAATFLHCSSLVCFTWNIFYDEEKAVGQQVGRPGSKTSLYWEEPPETPETPAIFCRLLVVHVLKCTK